MGFFSSKSNFPWVNLESMDQFMSFYNEQNAFLVFKHSTRCSISSMALRSFEKEFDASLTVTCLFLDLLKYREISNEIAEVSNVFHQSPQLILFQNKKVLLHASHEKIDASNLIPLLK